MVHCGPPVALLTPRLIVPPSPRLPPSLSPRRCNSPSIVALRNSEFASAQACLPCPSWSQCCLRESDPSAERESETDTQREGETTRERYVCCFFPSPCLVLLGQRKKKRFVHGRHGFSGLLLLWSFRWGKSVFCTAVLLESFVWFRSDAHHQERMGFVCLFVCLLLRRKQAQEWWCVCVCVCVFVFAVFVCSRWFPL